MTGPVDELELSPAGGRAVSSSVLWAWPGCGAVVRAESLQWLERPVSGMARFIVMEQLFNAREHVAGCSPDWG